MPNKNIFWNDLNGVSSSLPSQDISREPPAAASIRPSSPAIESSTSPPQFRFEPDAMPVKATGFTILQTPPDPALDIIFVHGLQGHPERTWTFQDAKVSAETEGPRKKKQTTSLCCPFFLGKPRKRSATTDVPQPQAVFWPRDLLGQSGSCAEARIITYGYDSVILGLGEGGPANFSTISEHGQALLQGAARVRREDMNRPLMFIAHSLGGLVVKAVSADVYAPPDQITQYFGSTLY